MCYRQAVWPLPVQNDCPMCDMISRWFLHQVVWNDRPICDVISHIISVLDFKAGYLADADVAFELCDLQNIQIDLGHVSQLFSLSQLF